MESMQHLKYPVNRWNNILLIGLPGSGKSSFCKANPHYAVISTDEIRKFLYGNEIIQGEWYGIFQEIKIRYEIYQEMGQPVIYDATNLTRAFRMNILESLPGDWEAVALDVDPWECWKRNNRRERVVPGVDFNRMVNSFEWPSFSEGFKDITWIKN